MQCVRDLEAVRLWGYDVTFFEKRLSSVPGDEHDSFVYENTGRRPKGSVLRRRYPLCRMNWKKGGWGR